MLLQRQDVLLWSINERLGSLWNLLSLEWLPGRLGIWIRKWLKIPVESGSAVPLPSLGWLEDFMTVANLELDADEELKERIADGNQS